MKLTGYSNPLRGPERSFAPDFAQREFRDPGLRRGMGSSGLGSMHHTMPHLQRLSGMRLQAGGSLDPVGTLYAASRPNLYNPDPMRRSVLSALRMSQSQFQNPVMREMPFAGASFAYAQGGGAPDVEDVMEPAEDQSPEDAHLRDVVLEAIAALEGQSPDPEEALAHFIDVFGPQALADLQGLAEHKHRQEQEGEEDEESDVPEEEETEAPEEADQGEAEGGLLEGQGTGQSDEIQGRTASGRPVLLSDGEYVIDAPTVAALGDGSSSAGARRLDALRRAIRQNAYGSEKQAKPMAKGGHALVIHFGKA